MVFTEIIFQLNIILSCLQEGGDLLINTILMVQCIHCCGIGNIVEQIFTKVPYPMVAADPKYMIRNQRHSTFP